MVCRALEAGVGNLIRNGEKVNASANMGNKKEKTYLFRQKNG